MAKECPAGVVACSGPDLYGLCGMVPLFEGAPEKPAAGAVMSGLPTGTISGLQQLSPTLLRLCLTLSIDHVRPDPRLGSNRRLGRISGA